MQSVTNRMGTWVVAAALVVVGAGSAMAYPTRPVFQNGQPPEVGAAIDAPESFFKVNIDPIRPRTRPEPTTIRLTRGLTGLNNDVIDQVTVPAPAQSGTTNRAGNLRSTVVRTAAHFQSRGRSFFDNRASKRATSSGKSRASTAQPVDATYDVPAFAEPTEWNVTFANANAGHDVDGDGLADTAAGSSGGNDAAASEPTNQSFADLRGGGDVSNAAVAVSQRSFASHGAQAQTNDPVQELIEGESAGSGEGEEEALAEVESMNDAGEAGDDDEVFALGADAALIDGGINTANAASSPEPMTAGLALLGLGALGVCTRRRRRA